MERNYEDKYNIDLIGKTGAVIYKLPFYILKAEHDAYLFARYNPIDDCFYDYRWRNNENINIQNGDLSKLESGMLVEYSEFEKDFPDIVIPENVVINKELVQRERLDYDALSKKYGNKLYLGIIKIPLFTIINNYFEKRIDEGKEVDPYFADIINIVGKEMGLKIRTQGNYYDNCGYDYPEEIEQVIDGLYKLLTLRFQGIKPFIYPYNIYFNNYGNITDDYTEFIKELEYVTGIKCGDTDVINTYKSVISRKTRFDVIIADLLQKNPKFSFGKETSYYVQDIFSPCVYRQTITRGTPCYNWPFLKKLSPKEGEKVMEYIR